MSRRRRIHILTGEGIECEKEAYRFFSLERLGCEPRYQPVTALFHGQSFFERVRPGEWVYLPGGFSFADHFGSGRLLAYRLQEVGFFERCQEKELHLLGVCNGFQVLVHGQIFGPNTRLLPNQDREGKPLGFVNRWIECVGTGPLAHDPYRLPVRHGEGRLTFEGQLPQGVRPFLLYRDPVFDNGSVEKIAGLSSWRGRSSAWGLMPHPEIALRPIDHPDSAGPDFTPDFRELLLKNTGDGVQLLRQIFQEVDRHA